MMQRTRLEAASKTRVTALALVVVSACMFFLGTMYLSWTSCVPSGVAATSETALRRLIANFDAVVKDYAPVKFVGPLSTEEACSIFSFLYRRGYFRARFGKGPDHPEYHTPLPTLPPSKDYEDFYTSKHGRANTRRLRDWLAKVDRRRFYRHVVREIAGDGNVYAIRRWVAQNIAWADRTAYYTDDTEQWPVLDGAELIFIGHGQCGQTNRLLGSLLKFGAGQNARVVATPGHVYVEWRPRKGKKRILDGDRERVATLPAISVAELIADPKRARLLFDLTCHGSIYNVRSATAYTQDQRGDAWFVYYDLSLSKDGTKLLQTSTPKIKYRSPGHESITYKDKGMKLTQAETTRVEVNLKVANLQDPVRMHVWITKLAGAREPVTMNELLSYDWVKRVIASGSGQIGPKTTKAVATMDKRLSVSR